MQLASFSLAAPTTTQQQQFPAGQPEEGRTSVC